MTSNSASSSKRSARIAELKNEIGELGSKIDSYKAKTAAAMGGGVFLLLLGGGGGYDLIKGNQSISVSIGISQDFYQSIVIFLGACGLLLFAIALLREYRKDRQLESRLTILESELADLLEEESR